VLLRDLRQREQTKWQIQRLCQTDLAHFCVETGMGKARAGALSFPLEFTKTVGKRPLVERISQAIND
jgi:hypothetical protein